MNKKTIAIVLTLVMMFNFIGYSSVQAEPITLGVGYLVFAALLTSLGVTVTTQADMESLYKSFSSDSTINFTDYLSSAKLLLQGVYEQGVSFVPNWDDTNISKFCTWVRSKFSTGSNSYKIEPKFVNYEIHEYDYDINNPTSQRFRTIRMTADNNPSYYFAVNQYFVSYTCTKINNDKYDFVIETNGKRITRSLNKYYADNIILEINYHSDGTVSPQFWYSAYGALGTYTIDAENPTVPNIVTESQIIPYIGSDVLTNPTWQPQQVPIPPPPVNFPGIQDTPDGRTYSGTPQQLVQDLDDNPSAVQEMADQYLDQNPYTVGGIGSIPYYNSGTGTITFPNTTADNPAWDIQIDTPFDVPIDIPADIPIPADVPSALGPIGWLLNYIAQGVTGIYNILANMFSAPTKAITLEPLMNLNVKERFPFCLPWDLYNTLQGISADPLVPVFEGYIKDVSLKIDFTVFEPLAVISRWAFTVIYTFSLIMISRRLIGGE